MATRDNAINVYTDGSCLPSPRSGGIGVRIVTFDGDGNEVIEDEFVPGYRNATNNQMELLACIKGIQSAIAHPKLAAAQRICVFTDSRYVADNIAQAMFVWPRNRWRTKSGAPVLNAKQWKDLIREIQRAPKRVDVQWVKGHSRRNPHNKAVDKLAKQSAKVPLNPPLAVVNVRRKRTPQSVLRGSVRMEGQTVVIRVITSEYLTVQRLSKYKYEVLNTESRYCGCVDVAFSNEDLSVGHHYHVELNADSDNPAIVRVLGEVDR